MKFKEIPKGPYDSKPPKFGKNAKKLFSLDPSFIALNHGSWGAPPTFITEIQRYWQTQAERNPDLHYRFQLRSLMDNARSVIGKIFGLNTPEQLKSLVFCQNTSMAVNSVLRSLIPLFCRGYRPQPFTLELVKPYSNPPQQAHPTQTCSSRPCILHFSTLFSAVHETLLFLNSIHPEFNPIQIKLTYPINDDSILKILSDTIASYPPQSICLVILDAISSKPGVLFPFQKVIRYCRDLHLPTLLDGAHAAGQIDIHLPSIHPTFFVTNLHKWMYAPRGCAILYISPHYESIIHPAVVSYGYSRGCQEEFSWIGTQDYSAFITAAEVIQFREWLGGESVIQNYTHSLAVEGGQLLSRMFQTKVMENDSNSLTASMVNILLPVSVSSSYRVCASDDNENIQRDDHDHNQNDVFMKSIGEILITKYNAYATVYYHHHEWWLRVSAQIYNDLDDFQRLGEYILEILSTKSIIMKEHCTSKL